MSMVSPLHPLFHAESCQADIQTLRWKAMLSITAPATRDRPRQAGRKRWVASHAGAATSASPGGATMTRIGQP
jgi:hypothetical protein